MPEEVLLLEYAGNPPPRKVEIHILVASVGEVTALMHILERMAHEKVGDGADLTFIIKADSRISGGFGHIENGGLFGFFEAEKRRSEARQHVRGTGDSIRHLSGAVMRSTLAFIPLEILVPLPKESKLSSQVSCYGPVGRDASFLRRVARKRK